MWWDEYEYHDVTEDGVPFDRVLLFVGANEDHTGYLYLAAFDNNSDEAVAAYGSGFKWALTREGNIVLSDPVTDESMVLTRADGDSSYGDNMTNVFGTSLTYADGSVILANASYSGTLYKASAQQQTDVQSQAILLPKNASSSDIGKQICVDGHVHTAGVKDYCPADRVAMITYVGNDAENNTKYNHGLALALSDADDGDRIEWCDRKGIAVENAIIVLMKRRRIWQVLPIPITS